MKDLFSFTFIRTSIISCSLIWSQILMGIDSASNSEAVVEEAEVNHQLAAEHDKLALQNGAPNSTNCREKLNNEENLKFIEMRHFEQVFLDQQLDKVRDEQDNLARLTSNMNQIEETIDVNAGTNPNGAAVEQLKNFQERTSDAKKRIESAQNTLNSLGDGQCASGFRPCASAVEEKYTAYMTAKNACTYSPSSCTTTQLNDIETKYTAWRDTRQKYYEAASDLSRANKELNKVAGRLPHQQINAEADATKSAMDQADATQSQSNAISGISGDALTGPLAESYERLTSLYNSTTIQAERLAQIQTEKLAQLEMENAFNGDFRLYEMALENFGTVDSNESDFSARPIAQSNLDMMANAAAAAKNLVCRKHPKSEADSKAYYIFKAAAATYLMAEINDTTYFSNTSDCRAHEVFNNDLYDNGEFYDPACKTMGPDEPHYELKCQRKHKDMQMLTVERATNLYTEVFENMCMKINPSDETLARECRDILFEILDENAKDQNGNYIRTREVALAMFGKALEAAHLELNTKVQKVTTAHANVEKGKKWVKRDIKSIAKLLILTATFLAMAKAYSGQCPLGPLCGLAPPTWVKWALFSATLAYYTQDLIRAQLYLSKWKKKRDSARHYTHLECNQDDAFAETAKITAFAKESQEKARSLIEERKDAINRELGIEQLSDLTNPTVFREDADIAKKITFNLKNARTPKQANILISDYIRLKNGAKNSLPYNRPPQFFDLNQKLKKMGLVLVKKFKNGTNAFVDFILPNAEAVLTSSLGIVEGSSSFAYFLTTRNQMWKDQALDVTKPSNRIETPVDYMSTTDGYVLKIQYNEKGKATSSSQNLAPENITGFPLPDTRIVTIQNMVNTLTGNLGHLNDGLEELAVQRKNYIDLLRNMKEEMTLDKKGVASIESEEQFIPRGRCLILNSHGGHEVDESCKCQSSGTCASFNYPNLGDYLGSTLTNDSNIVKAANSFSSGNLAGGSVAGASLLKNATRIRKKNADSAEELRRRTGRNLASTTNSQKAASLKKAYGLFKKNNPIVASFNKNTTSNSGLANKSYQPSSGYHKRNQQSNNENKNANDDEINSLSLDHSEFTQGRGIASIKDNNIIFQENLDHLNGTHTNSIRGKDKMGEGLIDSYRGKNLKRSYHHKRLSKLREPGEEVHTSRKKNLFGIISNRYQKSAFPIFLKRKKENKFYE